MALAASQGIFTHTVAAKNARILAQGRRGRVFHSLRTGGCLVAAAPMTERALGPLDLFTVVAGLGSLALLWTAGGRLARIADTNVAGSAA